MEQGPKQPLEEMQAEIERLRAQMPAEMLIALARRWQQLNNTVSADTVKEYEDTYQDRLLRDTYRDRISRAGFCIEQRGDGLSLRIPD